jgi:subtilisin family serine protease
VLESIQVKSERLQTLPILGMATIEASDDSARVLEQLASHSEVRWAEYSIKRPFHGPAREPLFSYQWALRNTADPEVEKELEDKGLMPVTMIAGADVRAPRAWKVSPGAPKVVAAILDSGVDYNHVDLASNMWVNEGEVPGNGIDDDNNGYVDDLNGWHAFQNHGDPMDTLGHGTHVAGIVAAAANGRGVAGTAPGVRIMAVNVLDPATQWEDDAAIIAGIEYILNQAWRGANVRVVNISLGGPGKSRSLQYALSSLARQGILAVVSTGNESISGDLFVSRYPVSYPLPNLITAGASDPADQPAYFSNFGEYSTDIFAPGVAIVSSIPDAAANEYSWTDGNFFWSLASGTSMSAPMVTGAVALAASIFPSADWRQLKDLVLLSGKPLKQLRGETRYRARLNLAAMAGSSIPEVPVLYRLGHPLPIPGRSVSILGHNLGGAPGSVMMGRTPVQVLSWKSNKVQVRLPEKPETPGPEHTLTLTTNDGRQAAMPFYMAQTGGKSWLRLGNTGDYGFIAPYDKKMAAVDQALYGLIQCGPSSAGELTPSRHLAWGRLGLVSNRLDYLGELPRGLEDPERTAIASLGEFVYCAGGVKDGAIHRYHVPSGKWDHSTPQPMAGLLWDPLIAGDGSHLYLTGGMVWDPFGSFYMNSKVYRFDPGAAKWTVAGDWKDVRPNAAALVTGNKLLLAGGSPPPFAQMRPFKTCDVLDLKSGEWIKTEMPVGAESGELARVGDTLLYFGPSERMGSTTPFVLSASWPLNNGEKWRIHPVRFDFLDLDRTSAWTFVYQGGIGMAGGDLTGCPSFPCRIRLLKFTLPLM